MTQHLSKSISFASVCELTTEAQIRAAQRLRFSVWQSEGVVIHNPEREMIADHHDDHATHWGVFDGDLLIGAARLCLHTQLLEAPDGELFVGRGLPTPVASMNRLVVAKSHRGLGIGNLLDEVRIRKAEDWAVRAIIIAPAFTPSRRQSLEHLGFHFLEGVCGFAVWSPTVRICACYLLLDAAEERHG
jgi:GNAT superfamily N-acetyltransferase